MQHLEVSCAARRIYTSLGAEGLITGLLPRMTWLDPSSAQMIFMTLKQGFLRVLRLCPVSIIPPVPYTHLHLHVARIRTNGRSLLTFQIAMLFFFVNRETLD